MFKEITENTISKVTEDIVIPQWLLVLIAAASFIVGLIVGILCAAGTSSAKMKKRPSFRAEEYARELNFEDEEDDEGYEYSF